MDTGLVFRKSSSVISVQPHNLTSCMRHIFILSSALEREITFYFLVIQESSHKISSYIGAIARCRFSIFFVSCMARIWI